MYAFLAPALVSPFLSQRQPSTLSRRPLAATHRRPRASAISPTPPPPPPPPPSPLERLPDSLRGVNETAPFYAALLFAQALPFIAPSRGTLVDVAYFTITAVSALVIGCKRSPLQSADLQAPLTGKQVIFAPLAATFTLFSAYVLLKYTPLDIGLVLNGMTTLVGGLCLKESLDPLIVSLLATLSIPNRAVYDLETPETPGEDVAQLDLSDAVAALTALSVVVLYLLPASVSPLADYHFVFSNTIAIGIAARVLSLIRPDSFRSASGLLVGLTLYDIFAVFLSPLFAPNGDSIMVTVALKIDSPGKLLFPRDPASLASAASYPFAVLGLGDLCVPGIFMTLALALDAYLVQDRDPAGPPALIPAGPYFRSAVVAYVLGLGACFGVNFVTSAAQPALLYLVPALISSSLITAVSRGEFKDVWGFRSPAVGAIQSAGDGESKSE